MQRYLFSFLLLVCSLPALADHLSKLTELAEQNDVNAEYQLAVMYQQGRGTEANPDNAFYWFLQAARQGHPRAQTELALAYLNGNGTDVNFNQAIYWLTHLAMTGDKQASLTLARTFKNHQAPVQSADLAEIWYHLAAADNPDAEREYNLLLENKFNQQRARQISDMQHRDQQATSEPQPDPAALTTPPAESGNLTLPDLSLTIPYLPYAAATLALIVLMYCIKRFALLRQNNQRRERDEQHQIIRAHKQQLAALHQQLKQARQQNQRKLAVNTLLQ